MTHYIDKSAIVAEIESLRRSTFTNFDEGVNCAVQTLLEIIDTLEVKEVQEEPVSKDLEEAADNYVGHAPEIDEDLSCFTKRNAFIAGAKWQEEQCQKTIELAEDHAYLAGQEKVIEKACEWLKCNFNMPNDFESHFKKAMEE